MFKVVNDALVSAERKPNQFLVANIAGNKLAPIATIDFLAAYAGQQTKNEISLARDFDSASVYIVDLGYKINQILDPVGLTIITDLVDLKKECVFTQNTQLLICTGTLGNLQLEVKTPVVLKTGSTSKTYSVNVAGWSNFNPKYIQYESLLYEIGIDATKKGDSIFFQSDYLLNASVTASLTGTVSFPAVEPTLTAKIFNLQDTNANLLHYVSYLGKTYTRFNDELKKIRRYSVVWNYHKKTLTLLS